MVDSALDQKNAARASARRSTCWPRWSARTRRRSSACAASSARFHPRFVVNQVRAPADVAVGHQLVTACARHLGMRAGYAGFVHYDDAVWQAVRQRRLFVDEGSRTARAAEEVAPDRARAACEGETLALAW